MRWSHFFFFYFHVFCTSSSSSSQLNFALVFFSVYFIYFFVFNFCSSTSSIRCRHHRQCLIRQWIPFLFTVFFKRCSFVCLFVAALHCRFRFVSFPLFLLFFRFQLHSHRTSLRVFSYSSSHSRVLFFLSRRAYFDQSQINSLFSYLLFQTLCFAIFLSLNSFLHRRFGPYFFSFFSCSLRPLFIRRNPLHI